MPHILTPGRLIAKRRQPPSTRLNRQSKSIEGGKINGFTVQVGTGWGQVYRLQSALRGTRRHGKNVLAKQENEFEYPVDIHYRSNSL